MAAIQRRATKWLNEVHLISEAVANATGYRVLRADTADGEYAVTTEIDITTGAATASADVVNVFSDQYSYIPQAAPSRVRIGRRSSPMSMSAPASAASG